MARQARRSRAGADRAAECRRNAGSPRSPGSGRPRRSGPRRAAPPRPGTRRATGIRDVRRPRRHGIARRVPCAAMDEIGLFPLGIVLLPTERVPLHVFEPRYRELIGGCLEDGHEFGLVYADECGLRDFGTRARVTDLLEEFDDVRMNVIVEGGERFRLLELTS